MSKVETTITVQSRVADYLEKQMLLPSDKQNRLTLKACSRILSSRKEVKEADYIKARVVSVSSQHDLLDTDPVSQSNAGAQQILLNYDHTTADLAKDANAILREAILLAKEGRMDEAELVAGYATNQTLRSRIVIRPGSDTNSIPSQGEIVKVMVDWVTPETGPNAGKSVLRATGRPTPVEAVVVTTKSAVDTDLLADIEALTGGTTGSDVTASDASATGADADDID